MCGSTSPQPCTSPITYACCSQHCYDAICIVHVELRPPAPTPYRHGCCSVQTWSQDGCLLPSVWLMLRFSYQFFCCHCLLPVFVLVPSLYRFAWAHQSVLRYQQFCLSVLWNQPVSFISASADQTWFSFHYCDGSLHHYSPSKWKRLNPSTLYVHALGLLWRCSDDAGCGGVVNEKQSMTFIFLLFVTRLFKRLWREIWCPEWPDGQGKCCVFIFAV